MVNQQLSDYIGQQLQQGKSKEEIKSELLRAGWQDMDISNALGISDSVQPPRPPSASPVSSFTPTGPQQLDPKAVWLFFLRWVFVFLFTAIWIGLAALSDAATRALGVGLLVFLGILVVAFIWAKLTYHFYRYELREEGFRKEMGVIFKKYVTIPYGRIQNVDIYRGILARILGLSDLNIQTAGMSTQVGKFGGGSAEGRLLGISRETAEQLRNELINRSRQTRGQGL